MKPFVEGLCQLHSARLIYRTFTTVQELRSLFNLTPYREKGRFIIYVAGHGDGGRLVVDPGGDGINLSTVARSLNRPGSWGRVESVWLGTCDVANAKSMREFLVDSGARLVGGYRCAVDWETSLLIDLSVLQSLLSSGEMVDRKRAIAVLGRGLRPFSSGWPIGDDHDGQRQPLVDAIRVLARDKARRGAPEDITERLLARLKWRTG